MKAYLFALLIGLTISYSCNKEYITEYENFIHFGAKSPENYLYISAILNSYFDTDDISVVAVKEKNGEYELFKGAYLENDNHKNKRYVSVDWSYSYPFDIKIPIILIMMMIKSFPNEL